jgi:hypothetical protein
MPHGDSPRGESFLVPARSVCAQEYGYREKPKRSSTMEHVQAIERVRGMWRVEWIDPNPGLQDFVASSNIVVPWKMRKAFLKEESDWQRLREASEASSPGHDHPVDDAVTTVLEATGDRIWGRSSGVLTGEPDALEHVGSRAEMILEIVPPALVGRDGKCHLLFERALELAQAFAKAEPGLVLAQISSEEAEMEQMARDRDSVQLRLMHNRYLAGWALARQWAGFDSAVETNAKEPERLWSDPLKSIQ